MEEMESVGGSLISTSGAGAVDRVRAFAAGAAKNDMATEQYRQSYSQLLKASL